MSIRKTFTINNIFTDLFNSYKVTQIEFGHLTDTNRTSVNDWIRHKNQITFNKFEEMMQELGYDVEIVLTKKSL
jgi:serine protease inhibitor